MKKLNQRAFAPVEILVVVLVLIVVAFVGYSAWQKSTSGSSGNDSLVTNPDADAISVSYRMLWNSQVKVQACRISTNQSSGVKVRSWFGRRGSSVRGIYRSRISTSFTNRPSNNPQRILAGRGNSNSPRVFFYAYWRNNNGQLQYGDYSRSFFGLSVCGRNFPLSWL